MFQRNLSLFIGPLLVSLFAQPQTISIKDSWIRPTITGQSSTGVFMQIESTEPIKLIGASSSFSEAISINEMKVLDGIFRVTVIPRLEIPQDKVVVLKPGGNFLMMTGLNKVIDEGLPVDLTFKFEKLNGAVVEGRFVSKSGLPQKVKPISTTFSLQTIANQPSNTLNPELIKNNQYLQNPTFSTNADQQAIIQKTETIKPANSENERLSLDAAKNKCTELGFKPATEVHGKCVLQLSK
jgi:copper(I)-binding protein